MAKIKCLLQHMNGSKASNAQSTELIQYDREPAFVSGSIQPHGILLAVGDSELNILQVSANTWEYLSIQPQDLLGQPLQSLLNPQIIESIQQELETTDKASFQLLSVGIPSDERWFDGTAHRLEKVILLELEPTLAPTEKSFLKPHTQLKRAIAQLRQVSNLSEFLQLVTEEVRKITGFDRVMVYQFDPQGAGAVMAEAKRDDLPPYVGLHYPATDIPDPVRALYQQGLLRFIPNLSARSVELIPAENQVTSQPLDLSRVVLRAVDPCCVAYHRNMGVAAILVISLIKEQTLWGLISCHHQVPKPVPYDVRETCELLGLFISSELASKVDHEELDYRAKLRSLQSEFVEAIAQVDNLKDALVNPAPRLLDLVSAQGAAVCLEDEITLVGTTPTVEHVRALIQWADTQLISQIEGSSDNTTNAQPSPTPHSPLPTPHSHSNALFHTHSLPTLYSAAEAFKQTASGLLLLRISKVRRYYVLWFRPEVLQIVNWAGDPNESITVAPDGSVTLSPRTSFAQWQETVRFTSLPWKICELENALDLRNAIVGLVLNKADDLARINRELERSNRELDSFAYAASHDLKEPLRGIHNYATLLLKGYADVLDDTGKARLQTLIRLTRRMESLIDVLLKFSRLGQSELQRQSTDLNQVVDQVLEDLHISYQNIHPDIRIPRSLPTIHCDPVLTAEVFTNLLSNAFKYNDKPEQWIEIGFLEGTREDTGNQEDTGNEVEELTASPRLPLSASNSPTIPHSPPPHLPTSPPPHIFYIRDNGIGIRERHLQTIFRLFKRLHEQSLYGGGTGAGLTIAKKIIERHGGQIWAESTYGESSTFYFTLES